MAQRTGAIENIPATLFEGSDLAVLILIINWLTQTEGGEKESERARDQKKKNNRGGTARWNPMPNRSA